MPILLSQTFEVVTEESAENGEAAERGFDFQDQPYGFRETVELIQADFPNKSNSHGVPRWLCGEDRQDYNDGSTTVLSLHPGNDARSQRYWAKACKAAGVI